MVELDAQGLIELLGVWRLGGSLSLPAGSLSAGGTAVLAGPPCGLKASFLAALFARRLRKGVPHRGVSPLRVAFPGDEMGIVARET
ncbi:hypothetical protein [Streptomyces capillispiralis]|uniref:hypothetical protein n=1 Tax=Streptomyces capillispiralis TaxID=68182 RepID=UPI00142EDBC4|nr:hypothetical protein [Streptomyces capillispiralis]